MSGRWRAESVHGRHMVMREHDVTIEPDGPYRLASSIRFLEGFTPAELAGDDDARLRIAFPVDGSDEAAAVSVKQDQPDGPLRIAMTTDADPDTVRRQVARLLSLDHDGRGYEAVGERDPVIGAMQRRMPGFRPTGFWSPYEAAVWAIVSHRVRMAQAAKVKTAIGERFGTVIQHDGQQLVAFPAPSVLQDADLTSVPGLGGRKPEWLRGIAEAAQLGALDAERLRALPVDDALAHLQRLGGVGPFSAELILVRGAMPADCPVRHESRLAAAVRVAYGWDHEPNAGELARIVDGWTPFRTWVSVLVRSAYETTGAGD